MPTQPPIAVVLGSDSDLPVLQKGIATLKELGVAVEVRVLSAHRTPDALREWLAGAGSARPAARPISPARWRRTRRSPCSECPSRMGP